MRLLVDNEETSLYDFLKVNLDEDAGQLTIDEVKAVVDLNINETVQIGMCDVKRIA